MKARPRSGAILSLTGGGMAARFSTEVLCALQGMRDPAYRPGTPGRSIGQAFDVLAGTSAGALVIAALLCGKAPPDISALLESRGPRIFPRSGWQGRLRWIFGAKYAPEPLHDAVDEVLGGGKPVLGDFEQILAFPAFDESLGVPLVLTNANPAHARVPLRDAVLASAAAPS